MNYAKNIISDLKVEYIEEDKYNPEVIIEKYKDVNVIRDDELPGGTKQRALMSLLKIKEYENIYDFMYAGPNTGYGQLALSYCAMVLEKKAHIFVNEMSPITKKCLEYGANVYVVKGAILSELQYTAYNYSIDRNIEFMPFGFDCEAFEFVMIKQLEKSCKKLIKLKPKRMWVVAGSGAFTKCLMKVLPNTQFLVVQVGKTVKIDNVTIYIAPQKFYEKTNVIPPYPSVLTYDAKIWQFYLKHGKKNDFIWNLGKDI